MKIKEEFNTLGALKSTHDYWFEKNEKRIELYEKYNHLCFAVHDCADRAFQAKHFPENHTPEFIEWCDTHAQWIRNVAGDQLGEYMTILTEIDQGNTKVDAVKAGIAYFKSLPKHNVKRAEIFLLELESLIDYVIEEEEEVSPSK